jgi:cytochrome c-type biogenesis protein CcmH/NrfG
MGVTPSKVFRATLAFALVALASACGGGRVGSDTALQEEKAGAQKPPAQSNAGGGANAPAPADLSKLDADIERLEKAAERNPGDEDTRDELARAYVRRGNAKRGAGQLREALADYQRALRLDPDSEEAQAGAAATTDQLGGEQQEDENGAPVPLPITPNVADEEGKPTPTPKKSDK